MVKEPQEPSVIEPKSMPPTALNTFFMVISLAILFALAFIVAFLQGKPAPTYPPLQENSAIVLPSP
jgi:hypothetical protein